MKHSTKLMATAIAAVAIFFGTQANAQTKSSDSPWRLGLGVEAGVPTGAAISSNFELGGTARLQYGADKGLAYTLTSGYYNFFPKASSGASAGVVPVKAGIKAYFADNVYFGAEGGVAIVTGAGSATKLDFAPGLGYSTKSVDIGVRYENFSGQNSNFGLIGLRLAYGFGL